MKIIPLIFLGLILVGCGGSSGGDGGGAQAATGVTIDKLAGTWDYMGSGTVVSGSSVCGFSFRGTITISSDGSADLDQVSNDSCDGSSSGQATAQITVSTNGSGTMVLTDTLHFQVSKDLNTIIFTETSSSDSWTSGTALRR